MTASCLQGPLGQLVGRDHQPTPGPPTSIICTPTDDCPDRERNLRSMMEATIRATGTYYVVRLCFLLQSAGRGGSLALSNDDRTQWNQAWVSVGGSLGYGVGRGALAADRSPGSTRTQSHVMISASQVMQTSSQAALTV